MKPFNCDVGCRNNVKRFKRNACADTTRVKGNFEKTSDLDILIKAENEMPADVLFELKEKFDESNLPYIVNFVQYASLDKDFYKKIEHDLVALNCK